MYQKLINLNQTYPNVFVNIDSSAYSHSYGFNASQFDSIIFSGHKFYGGIGTQGTIIIKKNRIKNLEPYNLGGGVILKSNPFSINYDNEYICGSKNTSSYIKLAKCIDYVIEN